MRARLLTVVTIVATGLVICAGSYPLLESLAYQSIILEMQRHTERQCDSEVITKCETWRSAYVECPEQVSVSSLDIWWQNRGEQALQALFNEQFAANNFSFEKLKEWSACKGLLVVKKFNSINVTSPAKYGFTLFGGSIPILTHGSSIEVKLSSPTAVHVRLVFTYL